MFVALLIICNFNTSGGICFPDMSKTIYKTEDICQAALISGVNLYQKKNFTVVNALCVRVDNKDKIAKLN